MDSTTVEKWVTTTSIVAVVVGLIVGLALGYWWGSAAAEDDHDDVMIEDDAAMDDDSMMEDDDDSSDSMTGGISETGGSVSVSDQAAGALVELDRLTLSGATWVAVRDERGIMGAQWLPVGTYTDATVTLLRPTVAGETYFIVLYADNGDKQFSSSADTVVVANAASFKAE